jgi:hypothetical protein
MDSTSASNDTNTSTTAAAAEQLKATLNSADSSVNQGIQNLKLLQQARLNQANRTVAALTAQYGASDPRVKAAQAAVTATKTALARVTMVHQQVVAPAVQVAATGWALQGYVLDAQLQPAAKYTVFLVDASKAYQAEYGFAYTDDTGYFLLNYAGAAGQAAPAQLYIEVANPDANPVYLSSTAFAPVLGTASFQNIVLPAGGQILGDPPAAIRAVALPGKDAGAQTGPTPSSTPKTTG